MRRVVFALAGVLGVVACTRNGAATSPGTRTLAAMAPDSECGEMVEYVPGHEPATLLGSCSDGKTCKEYRWDADSDPSMSLKTHCEEEERSKWSVGMCPEENVAFGCRAVVLYERCRSMTTTWVFAATSTESEKKRCIEIRGELVTGRVASSPPPVTPDP